MGSREGLESRTRRRATALRNAKAAKAQEARLLRGLVDDLEHRRVLFVGYASESPAEVIASVLYLRNRLADFLRELPYETEVRPVIKSMATACLRYLSHREASEDFNAMVAALSELRAAIGVELLALEQEGYVTVQGPLRAILRDV